ncbi:hypothetical protein M8C21_022315 [Ambrosia artemisiifolia]|uniref:Uncharacterized protein n=1 Tax=Ambrosia artemisiifolia TaxID=4212 RepID=A0AAD5GEZ1_AMBAR|nr:hypothetical protein M8C21_022315 [Ambrosia artemisiifolia]
MEVLYRPSMASFRIITTTRRRTLFFPKPIKQNPNFSSTTYNNPTHLQNLLKHYNFPLSNHNNNNNNIFKTNQHLLNSTLTDIETSLKILSSFNPSNNFIISTVYNCPRSVLEVSRKFDLYPDDGFRFSSATVTRVLEEFPMVITMSEEQIWNKVEFLLGLGIHRSKIDYVIRMYPGILGFGVKNRLEPLIGEFVEMGFKFSEIRDEIVTNPEILRSEVGELSKCLRMLNGLKCRVGIKEKIFSDGAFRASYNVKLRIDCLHKHGLSYRDVFSVVWREPRVVLYDLDEIDKKIEFLVNVMKFDVCCLVDVPEYLGVHFEKQIVPRYNVIGYLRSKGGVGDEVGLRSLVKFSRLRFYNLYVKPYPECEKIYGRFADVKVRQGHPEGLWKLFKPPKYSDSKEDVKNIRSFMEQLRQTIV